MNEANIDHLLQVTAPRSGWGSAGLGGGREERPAFDDHLAQASSPRVPAEPVRVWEPPPVESQPTADNPSTTVETIGSDLDGNDSQCAVFTPYENRQTDDNWVSDQPESESATAESAAADTDALGGTEEQTEDTELSQDESEGEQNELAIDLAAATDAAAAIFAIETQSTQVTEVIDQVAETSGGSEAVEPSAQETSAAPQEELPEDHGPQLQPVDDAAASDTVASIKPQSVPDFAATPGVTEIVWDAGQATTDAVRGGVAKGDQPAPKNANPDRPVAAPKRPRLFEREATSADAAQVNGNRDEAADAPPRGEPATKKVEHIPDEPRESAVTRTTAGRQAPRGESPPSAGRTPLAMAVQGQPTDTAQETAKADETDESVRPAAPQGPRTDALLHPLARLHRSGTAAARGHRESKSEEGPRVDATRFVNRVAKAFHTAQERGGTLQLRLSPPELGALRLELLVQDGVLAAKLETETPAARRVLLDHLPVLRDRLAEQNIRVERFDVDVRQEGGGHSPANPHEHRQQQPQSGSPHREPSRATVATNETIAVTPATTTPTTDTQINLVA